MKQKYNIKYWKDKNEFLFTRCFFKETKLDKDGKKIDHYDSEIIFDNREIIPSKDDFGNMNSWIRQTQGKVISFSGDEIMSIERSLQFLISVIFDYYKDLEI